MTSNEVPETSNESDEMCREDITVTASIDAVIIALLRRVGGRAAFTVNDLARAEQLHLERRSDGHKLELWIVGDT